MILPTLPDAQSMAKNALGPPQLDLPSDQAIAANANWVEAAATGAEPTPPAVDLPVGPPAELAPPPPGQKPQDVYERAARDVYGRDPTTQEKVLASYGMTTPEDLQRVAALLGAMVEASGEQTPVEGAQPGAAPPLAGQDSVSGRLSTTSVSEAGKRGAQMALQGGQPGIAHGVGAMRAAGKKVSKLDAEQRKLAERIDAEYVERSARHANAAGEAFQIAQRTAGAIQSIQDTEQREIAAAQQRLNNANHEFNVLSKQGVSVPPLFALAQSITMIGNALALGRGAAAGILTGTGGNTVAPIAAMTMGVIDKAIERELRAQETAISLAGKRVGMAENAIGRIKKHAKDRTEARLMLEDLQRAKVDAMLTEQLAQLPSETGPDGQPLVTPERAALEQMMMENKERRAKLQFEMGHRSATFSHQKALDTATLNINMERNRISQAMGMSKLQSEQFEKEQQVAQQTRDMGSYIVRPTHGPLSERRDKEVGEVVANYEQMAGLVGQTLTYLRKDAKQFGLPGVTIDRQFGEEQALVESLQAGLLLAAAKVEERGANLTEAEITLLRRWMFGRESLSDIFQGDENKATATFEKFAKDLDRITRKRIRSIGGVELVGQLHAGEGAPPVTDESLVK